MRAKSSKQRCPALCILWLELLCSCRVGGWSGHLTASGSRHDFPGVDHEGRQTCRLVNRCAWDRVVGWHVSNVLSSSDHRGGVEDTRLEAKDTKKIRDQGRKCKCFPKKKDLQKFFRSISKKSGIEKHFSADLQHFNHSKNSAVLEPRTGQFSRTWGFEAKDSKMCPRELYLCQITCILGSWLKAESKTRLKCFEMFRNVRRTCWNKYVDELE